MTTLTQRSQALLSALPGAVLLGAAAVGGAFALWNHDTEFSSLDNGYLAEFETPTAAGIADKSWMDSFDAFVDQRLPGRERWLEAHAATVTGVLRDPVLNDVYVGASSGRLLEKPLHQPLRETLASEADALSTAVHEAGADMLWVYAPRREEFFADELPEAWDNPYPERRRDVVDAWEATGDPVLDLTDALSQPDVRDVAFFRTDHHWTVDGASVATDEIVDALHDQHLPIGEDGRAYERRTGPEGFVGSIGREVTLGASDPEPFDYAVPEGGWRSRVCVAGGCTIPPFREDYLEDPDPYANRYEAWIGGDRGLTRLYNPDPAASGTAVLVKDSYGNPIATMLGERFTNLYVVDERHYDGVPLGQLVRDIGAQSVIVLHNQVSLLSEAFASDVWTQAGSGVADAPQDSNAATVAAYPDGEVISPAGMILSRNPDQVLDATLHDDASTLSRAFADKNIPVAWFYLPRKEEVFADKLTAPFGNPVADKAADVIAALQVGDPVVDMTAAMSDRGQRESYYYATDHHPSPTGARVIADAMARELGELGVTIGTDDRAYEEVSADLPFYGSQMADVPPGTSLPGDDFSWREPVGGWRAHQCDGDVCEGATVVRSWIDDPAWDANRYKGFLGQGFETVHLHNDAPEATGTVVLMKDSFSHAAAMLLAERVSDLYLVDERGWGGGSVADFAADVDADAVLIAHNQVSLLSAAFDRGAWSGA